MFGIKQKNRRQIFDIVILILYIPSVVLLLLFATNDDYFNAEYTETQQLILLLFTLFLFIETTFVTCYIAHRFAIGGCNFCISTDYLDEEENIRLLPNQPKKPNYETCIIIEENESSNKNHNEQLLAKVHKIKMNKQGLVRQGSYCYQNLRPQEDNG